MSFRPLLLFVLMLLAACGSGGGGEIGAPTVSETTPPDQATNVPVDSPIRAKFSSRIDPVTVNEKNFFVLDTSGPMAGAVTYQDGTAIFTPGAPLERGSAYNAVLTTGIKDLDGIPLSSNFTWAFTTEGEGGEDTTPPQIEATVPGDEATDVSSDSSIRVVFSEPIDSTRIHEGTFFTSGEITGAYSYDAPNRTAILKPSRPLPASTVITATVTKEVTDLAGNPLQSDFTWSFRTASRSDRTPPRVITKIPGENAQNVSGNSDISVTFDEDIDPVTLQSNFILTGPSGEVVPTRFSYNASSRTAILNPDSNLNPETTYQVSVKSGVQDLSGNATLSGEDWSFTTGRAPDGAAPEVTQRQPVGEDVSVRSLITVTFNEPIKPETLSENILITSDRDNLSSQISYDARSFQVTLNPSGPRLEYNTTYTVLLRRGIEDLAGNRLAREVSWTFTTIDPPRVEGMSPFGQGVPTHPPPVIQAVFSRGMKESSINQSSFQVARITPFNPQGVTVPGSISYADAVATFTPSVPLSDNTLYRMTLTTAIEDAGENPLPEEVTWTFQTAAPPDPPPRVASTTPADGAVDVSVNISSLSAQFMRPIDPSSLFGRFAVRETNGVCCLRADIGYDPGQQRAVLVFTEGPLAHGISYTAVLGAGIRSTSGTPMGSEFVWSFTTEAAPDAIPPSVVGGDPSDGAGGVPTTDLSGQPFPVQVDFSEPILASTVHMATFVVRRVDSEFDKPQLSGTYRTESSSVFFTPSSPYDPGKTYEVILTAGITDLAGNPLRSEVLRSFTTAP